MADERGLTCSTGSLHNDLLELVVTNIADITNGLTPEEVMQPFVRHALNKLGVCLVQIWSAEPRKGRLVLIAQEADQPIQSVPNDVIDASTSYTGKAFETGQPQHFASLYDESGRDFNNEALRKELRLQSLLSVPIHNIGNPHQTTMVVNFFRRANEVARQVGDQFADRHQEISRLLAASLESNLRERSSRMAARLSLALRSISRVTTESGCQAFAKSIQDALRTDWVSVYLENWNETALAKHADTFVKQDVGAVRSSARGQQPTNVGIPDLVHKVWRTNRDLLLPKVSQAERQELVSENADLPIASAILVPLHDVRGGCKGVVRCINFERTTENWRRPFSYEDIAIVEAMERSFALPLYMMLQSQMRDRSLSNLSHELRVPVTALRAVHERMQREYDVNTAMNRFRFPYFEEVHTFTSLMQRLLLQLQAARAGPESIELSKRRVKLLPQVIQPALRHTEPVLRQRGMKFLQISHSGFEELPQIEVDATLLLQVVFNLMDNMVKYFPSRRPPSEFSGSVRCERMVGAIDIVFSDNGDGIVEADRERIFDYGYRSEGAERSNVSGTGLGCWLAREIAKRHGGELSVRSVARPFEIVLRLRDTRLRAVQF